jgi:hypothetical protein
MAERRQHPPEPRPAVRAARLAAAAILAIAGCDAGADTGWTPEDRVRVPDGPGTRIRPSLAASEDQLPAADPLLSGFDGWPLVFAARHHDATRHTCAIEIARGASIVRTLEGALSAGECATTWDARDATGALLAPGPLTATARLRDAIGTELVSASSVIEIVRLGIDRVQLSGEPGARAPLLYRRTGGLTDGWYEIDAALAPWQLSPDVAEPAGGAALELPDRTPREAPAIWEDVLSPPLDPRAPDGVEHDTFSFPTAWIAGSEIDGSVRLSSSIAGVPAGGEPQIVEVRVVAPDGLEIEGDDAFADAREITLHTLGSPVPAVGRYDVTWTFRFEARRVGGEWQPIPGEVATSHRLYGLVAAPVFDSTAIPYRAWVDVVDRIAAWVGGESADESAVASALVEGVYGTMGLRYDTARGASFYTSYGTGFSAATFSMQRFEQRSSGMIINCSDAASILSAYGNMVGIDLRYHILTNVAGRTVGFDLNYIRAIGMPAFDDTPFDSGRGGFSYHAIVGSRDGRTWDATLAIDGDGAPAAPPHTMQLVQGVDAFDYLVALSSQPAEIQTEHDEKVRIR